MASEGYGAINQTDSKSAGGTDGYNDASEKTPLVDRSDHGKDFMEHSLWSRLVFKWFTPILFRGNEKQRLDPDDLELVPLPVDCTTEATTDRFEQCWKQELEKNPINPSLLKSLFRAFGTDYIFAGVLNGYFIPTISYAKTNIIYPDSVCFCSGIFIFIVIT